MSSVTESGTVCRDCSVKLQARRYWSPDLAKCIGWEVLVEPYEDDPIFASVWSKGRQHRLCTAALIEFADPLNASPNFDEARRTRGKLSSIDLLPSDCAEDVVWLRHELVARQRTQEDIKAEFNVRLAAKGAGPISKSTFSRFAVRLFTEISHLNSSGFSDPTAGHSAAKRWAEYRVSRANPTEQPASHETDHVRRRAKGSGTPCEDLPQQPKPAAAESCETDCTTQTCHIWSREPALEIRCGQYRLLLSGPRAALFVKANDGRWIRAGHEASRYSSGCRFHASQEVREGRFRRGFRRLRAALRRLLPTGAFASSPSQWRPSDHSHQDPSRAPDLASRSRFKLNDSGEAEAPESKKGGGK